MLFLQYKVGFFIANDPMVQSDGDGTIRWRWYNPMAMVDRWRARVKIQYVAGKIL